MVSAGIPPLQHGRKGEFKGMKKWLSLSLALLLVLGVCGLSLAEEAVIAYESRGVSVPATVVLPKGEGAFPLVVMAHGHGGSREENIGFAAIAKALAEKGIATIRMDFPGCGESTESFQKNALSNMKQDVLAAIEYAAANYPVNAENVGIFGYSMGGRIALELMAEEAYGFTAAALLAPAAGDIKGLFGGEEGYAALKATADKDGFVEFTTIYGQKQELSREWFADLEKYEAVATDAAAKFAGKALVIYAKDDEAVAPDISRSVAEALNAQVIEATGDGHSYGFYSDKADILSAVANGTADFFAEALAK